MKTLFVILIVLFALTAALTANAAGITTDRVAYCKMAKNRIMIFEYTGLPSEDEMLEHILKNKPYHTDGKMTAAYYYPKGSNMPRSGCNTMCKSVMQANRLLYEILDIDRWEFAYMIGFNGKTTFANCLKNPSHSLCRNN